MKDKLIEASKELKDLANFYNTPCLNFQVCGKRDEYIKQRAKEIVKDLYV